MTSSVSLSRALLGVGKSDTQTVDLRPRNAVDRLGRLTPLALASEPISVVEREDWSI
jgi:hypothetical protein